VRTIGIAVVLAVLPLAVLSAQRTGCDTSEQARFVARESGPPRLWSLLNHSTLASYEVDVFQLNPFYLSGDFDGDGVQDFAVWLRAPRRAGRSRLAVLRGSGQAEWLTPDSLLRYPGVGAWYVHPRAEPVGQGAGPEPPPRLRGDAIMVELPEASSALIYWNGRRFVSYWQGD